MITLDVEELKAPRKVPRLRKVHYGHYDSEFGRPHPVIRLGGKYLEEYGFMIGAPIDVNVEAGVITICAFPKSNCF